MTDQRSIRVLVTGFGPFPGVRTNPSGQFLNLIETRFTPVSGNVDLRTELLPTSWMAAEEFANGCLADFDPHVALHFGVHRRAGGFRIETRAQNRACTQPDVDGKSFGSTELVKNAPTVLRSNIPAEKLVQSLQSRGLPAQPSRDAGRYLCNMLFYLSLSRETSSPRQIGFIHIPPLASPAANRYRRNQPLFDMKTLLDGAELIVNQCIVAHRRAMRSVTCLG